MAWTRACSRAAWGLPWFLLFGCSKGPAPSVSTSAPSLALAAPAPTASHVAAHPEAARLAAPAPVAYSGHRCAVVHGGAVECWGDNRVGELGDGTNVPSPYWVRAGTMTDVVSVAVARDVSCAVTRSETVRCWGGEAKPRSARGSTLLLTPTDIQGLSGVARLALTATGELCALHRDGHVSCLRGKDEPGPEYGVPVTVAGLDATELTASGARFCAMRRSGEAVCWDHHDDKPHIDTADLVALPSGSRLPTDPPAADAPLPFVALKTTADLQQLAPEDVVAPPGRVAGLPECAGARPLWRCHYIWDGKELRAGSPAVRPPRGAHVYQPEPNDVVAVPIGARTLLFSSSEYRVVRQLVVRERIGRDAAVVRGQLLPGDPEPDQPDGEAFLLVSHPYAFWVEGQVAHFVVSKQLLNPP